MGRFERGLAKIPPREPAAAGHPPTDGPAAVPGVRKPIALECGNSLIIVPVDIQEQLAADRGGSQLLTLDELVAMDTDR
jgi:hypothetical protein